MRMSGLDLFSGIGGITTALSKYVKTIAYCEQDLYAQSVLLSRMRSGDIDRAPIWNDVRTLRGEMLPEIDIIFGGFPCQDISIAGRGKGLEGKRSGLYFQVERLVRETRPSFVFLENVPAIRTRGLSEVVGSLTALGYDCRWKILSASEVGAPHIRKRWFLLAHANSERKLSASEGRDDSRDRARYSGKNVSHALRERLEKSRAEIPDSTSDVADSSGWELEPDICRVVNGLPRRVDRIRCLGNSVVPKQAKEAFETLAGIKRPLV